ncbi:MAG: MauE/DoxX family redox-associated membrane protein [Streptosporangiaceae bacterium]
MTGVTLACKDAIAVLLVAAGGAKLADLAGFAATVRLFLPARTAPTVRRAVAMIIAGAEVVVGAASLSSPLAGWLNLAVLALCCVFVVASAVGYRRHPGRACRCFGALSGRSFDLAGVARGVLLAIGAALAARPVSPSLLQTGTLGRLGLAAGAAFIAWCAYTAAAAIGAGGDTRPVSQVQPGWGR